MARADRLDGRSDLRVAEDRAAHALVGKVIELADLLGVGVVVQGVETVEQLTRSPREGADSCQGFARPMPADTLDLLTETSAAGADLRLPVRAPA
jgi:sensor c-di-GMP phosphodiesterase-like protein